jgi:hypothetical protein
MAELEDVSLFIDPFSNHFRQDRLFEPSLGRFNGEGILEPWIYLRSWFAERGIRVFTADRLVSGEQSSEINVYMSFGLQEDIRSLAARPDVVMSAFFAFEGPIVEPSIYRNLNWVKDYCKRIYSFSDEASLAPFLNGRVELLPFCIPSPVESVDEQAWRAGGRKFMMMINGNKRPRLYVHELYTERLRALKFFGEFDEIDLYGIGWDVPPYRMGKTWMPYSFQRLHRALQSAGDHLRPDPLLAAARLRWRGAVEEKTPVLSRYTFALCFENQILKGWITEKIFDCFRAGTVPVYWGASDIEHHVAPEAFIDMRHFGGYGELREFLHALSPAEIEAYRTAGREYLQSAAFHPFTKQAFAQRCATCVAEDTGLALDASD